MCRCSSAGDDLWHVELDVVVASFSVVSVCVPITDCSHFASLSKLYAIPCLCSCFSPLRLMFLLALIPEQCVYVLCRVRAVVYSALRSEILYFWLVCNGCIRLVQWVAPNLVLSHIIYMLFCSVMCRMWAINWTALDLMFKLRRQNVVRSESGWRQE